MGLKVKSRTNSLVLDKLNSLTLSAASPQWNAFKEVSLNSHKTFLKIRLLTRAGCCLNCRHTHLYAEGKLHFFSLRCRGHILGSFLFWGWFSTRGFAFLISHREDKKPHYFPNVCSTSKYVFLKVPTPLTLNLIFFLRSTVFLTEKSLDTVTENSSPWLV